MASFIASMRQRMTQILTAFRYTREQDPRALPITLGVALAILVVAGLIGLVLGQPVSGIVTGVFLAIGVGLIIMGRRTSTAALRRIEHQPGAAAAVLQSMRKAWVVTPAIAATRKQEFVHRAVGRPGVVLVGEGASARVTALLKQERRKIQRVVGDVPVHAINVGNRDGQVPLGKLQMHLVRLPKAIKARDIGELDRRLSALGASNLPIPKGPLPTRGKVPKRNR